MFPHTWKCNDLCSDRRVKHQHTTTYAARVRAETRHDKYAMQQETNWKKYYTYTVLIALEKSFISISQLERCMKSKAMQSASAARRQTVVVKFFYCFIYKLSMPLLIASHVWSWHDYDISNFLMNTIYLKETFCDITVILDQSCQPCWIKVYISLYSIQYYAIGIFLSYITQYLKAFRAINLYFA